MAVVCVADRLACIQRELIEKAHGLLVLLRGVEGVVMSERQTQRTLEVQANLRSIEGAMFFGYWVYETECHRFAAEVAMARNGIPSMAQCRHGEHRPKL